ncbi:arsenite transporter [Trichosporon asahii var. asahii CBS 2479]|uniref:Arsenite transporter n=1 Tax=Trichosporon asahii var. asahii (strain ATCC 90039 / CBS 2479 / JCM 2466 / KCTC 7840 / NBRC 103889/ NCYC 2677 / UAMH 7654) TaxID=1186058 RepID=J6EVW5_TRIAS|nr:arsenite transporter [Trichosporon asahii var. asahii CBS 2479]EJT46952.1 arsenite transporter [Trichosporon asahii var. asahii CBS 2479]
MDVEKTISREKTASVNAEGEQEPEIHAAAGGIWAGLSWFDRLLPILVLLAMIIGVIIGRQHAGRFAGRHVEGGLNPHRRRTAGHDVAHPHQSPIREAPTDPRHQAHLDADCHLRRAQLDSRAIRESCHRVTTLTIQVMLGVAFATLPDQPTYRTGVIMVGLARCIAMVMIWNDLAKGDMNYCAILVIINSVLQIILYSPMSLLFVNVISNEKSLRLEYGATAIAVLIYLGIPLVAGIVTRFAVMGILGRKRFENHFLPWFGPLALLGLLYTQATRILDNIGVVFRVFVPMIVYFILMWFSTFALMYYLNRRYGPEHGFTYQSSTVQTFTVASNNFELAIAVCVAIYGVNSDQALAATIGPLVEVPVLLLLTYVSLLFGEKLNWRKCSAI